MDNTLMDHALESAGLAILVLDGGGRVIECSLPAAILFGFNRDALIGLPISAILPLDLATAPETVVDMTGVDRTNRSIRLAVRVVRWTDPMGRNLATVILRDSAPETDAVQARQREIVRSDTAIRGAGIGVFEYWLTTATVSVSGIWREMMELGPSEDLDVQVEWRSRVHPDDLAAALKPIELCGEDRAERATCEYRLKSRDGTRWRWMRTDVAVAQRDVDGRPSVLVGAQTDVDDRKQMEEALRISVERLRTAFDNAPIGKALVDLDGTWLRVNPALCNLLGYTEAELLRTDFQTLTHPDDLEADLGLLNRLLNGEIPSYTIEKRYYRANGAITWGMLSVGLIRDAKGKPHHLVSQIVDITEKRRLDEMRSEFVSVVSHELRTPLTAILGALTLLSTYGDDQLPDEVQRLLFIASTNSERLHNLINDILDFQKFAASQMPFTLAWHAIAKLVDDTLLANLAAADRSGVRYATQIHDRRLQGLVDAKRFHQIMANLLTNATKFAVSGSTVDVSVEEQGASIRIAVSNLGPGIPEAFHHRVFKPFSQASTSSDRRSGGTGLGLSITKQIVEQMGGEIGFDSVPDGKTTFWFTVRAGDEAA